MCIKTNMRGWDTNDILDVCQGLKYGDLMYEISLLTVRHNRRATILIRLLEY